MPSWLQYIAIQSLTAAAAVTLYLVSINRVARRRRLDRNRIDPLNRPLVTLCSGHLVVGGWNLLHVMFFAVSCVVINAGTDPLKHLALIALGVSWFLIEESLLSHFVSTEDWQEDIEASQPVAYDDITKPLPVDLFYNVLGQSMYVIAVVALDSMEAGGHE